MQATFITDIPQIGDNQCNKSLYELLIEVLPVDVLCGLGIYEVSYGYVEKYKCNSITLRLLEKDYASMSKDLIIAVFNKGEYIPVSISNQTQRTYVNWGIRFCNLGMFNTSDENLPIISNVSNIHLEDV